VTDMAQHGMLQENDIWRYSRAFHGGIITVKKELTVYYSTSRGCLIY